MISPSRDVSELLALLDMERRLLLDGQLVALAPLQDAKARLVERLGPGSVPPEALALIRGRAGSNLGLLAAARDGIGAALARLRELERLGQGGVAYDSRGARVDPPSAAGLPRTLRRV